MPEWWTYTLSDFLLFSPRTYYRMIERYNAAVWPGQLVALGLGIAIAWLLYRSGRWQRRIVSAVLALLWSWIAWAFLWKRYAAINWAATWFAWAFAIEAVLLAAVGGVRGRMSFQPKRDAGSAIGLGLFVAAVAFYPLLAPFQGRGWRQAEVFGVMPDPTVLGTLGLLLLAEGAPSRWALAVPVLWCIVSGATLWAIWSAGG
jgi:Family of unknown function (DUF6064)